LTFCEEEEEAGGEEEEEEGTLKARDCAEIGFPGFSTLLMAAGQKG